jgi:chromosome segregation protein
VAQREAEWQAREQRRRELERLERERTRAANEVSVLRAELEALQADQQSLQQRHERLQTSLAAAAEHIQRLAEGRSGLQARAEVLEASLAQRRQELSACLGEREAARLAHQQAADALTRLVQEAEIVADDWGLGQDALVQLRLLGDRSCEAAPSAVGPPTVDLESARRRMHALQRELRGFGAVGDAAIDEYREVNGRLEFLRSQSDDLERAMSELQGVIGELEGLMTEGFECAFERVNTAFARTFGTLFGGGTARLVMTDPADPLRTGVDIVAQPPGKRLQHLMSLSGGERALTSTALIFALLEINPLPFCVLDEVDAALDEPNAQRFAALLREFAERTQFLVITHNRATMETAGSLYGISMSGDGVTTVVSLRPAAILAADRNGQVDHGLQPALQA